MQRYAAAALLDASVIRVWNVLADLSNPAIGAGITERIEIDYTGDAPVRTLHLLPTFGGGAVREVIERLDPETRVLGYRVIDPGPVPMTHYEGEFRTTADGVRARLAYSARFDAPPGGREALAAVAAGNFATFVTNLARVLGVRHEFERR
jgi:hypothetical protein